MPLPLLAPLAIAGGAGVLQGTATALTGRKEAKRRKERIKELRGQIARDEFGLDADERNLTERQLMDPVRAFATEQQSANEAQLAARGSVSGADLARLRQDTSRELSRTGLDAAEKVKRIDLEVAGQERAQARAEEAGLAAAQEQRKADIVRGFMAPLTGAAQLTAAKVAGPPELFGENVENLGPLLDDAVAQGALSQAAADSIAGMDPARQRAFLRETRRAQARRL